MIKRADLRVVEDTKLIDGVKDFDKHIEELLSTDQVLMSRYFKVLYVLYNSSASNYASRGYISHYEQMWYRKFSKVFFINQQDYQSYNQLSSTVFDRNHKILENSGYDVYCGIFIKSPPPLLFVGLTVSWK